MKPGVFEEKTVDISAGFFAAEAGFDMDWLRFRASFLYGSGDDDAFDDKATGFDAIFENPVFAGSDTSYWLRQSVPLIGGGRVALSTRNGLLNNLRSTKEQGQSNFTNPGMILAGVGADADLLPSLRLSLNYNYMRFDHTEVLETVRNQGSIDEEIGHDLSASLIWRPLMTQNIVLRTSYAHLIPGKGFKDFVSRRKCGLLHDESGAGVLRGFRMNDKTTLWIALAVALAAAMSVGLSASEAVVKVERNYVMAPAAPLNQPSASAANDKSAGCVSCHTESDQKTMHNAPGVDLGCTDCHGGDPSQFVPHNAQSGGEGGHGLPKGKQSDDYIAVKELAHILPEYPEAWHYPHSANPERTYTLLNKESREFVRFIKSV